MESGTQIKHWVRDAQAGDESAWSSLYRQYFPGMYAIALGICRNSPIAKDAVQDAFLAAFLKLSGLKNQEAFGAWMKKIVIRNCYQSMEQANMYCRLDQALPESGIKLPHEQLAKWDWLWNQSRFQQTLQQLPEILTTVLLLRYFSDFSSYQQIAGILSIPVGTVRSRLNQAKLKFAEQWHRHQDPAGYHLKHSEEWNAFYHAAFSGMHRHDHYKSQFINHLQKDICIEFTSGKTNMGSRVIDEMVNEDREFGSWFAPAQVVSGGNVSIVEARHFNSAEYPDRCPESTVCVLYRHNGKATKMNLYASSRK